MEEVRKIFTFVFLLLLPLLLLFFPNTSLAQDEKSSQAVQESMIAPDYYPEPISPEPGFLGQDHNYTVVFRGNGEAVVSARIILTNKGDSALSEVKLRIPKVDPREVSVYQVIKEKLCRRYETQVYDPLTRSYPPQVCAEYQEPDYYQNYYSSGAKYQKAKVEMDIDTAKITLPQVIASGKSGSFFIYFRGLGYAKKNIFGAYNYAFETLKAEDSIRNLVVGISTDSDLFLKGVKGEVNYRFEDSAMQSLNNMGMAAPEKSVALDRYVSQIGGGTISKKASNLAALESYTVNGAYAKSRIRLYGKEISITALSIIIALVLFILVIRIVIKRFSKVSSSDAEPDKKSRSALVSSNVRNFFLSLGISFLSSILILFYTIIVFFIGSSMGRVIGYQYDAFFGIILVIISFVVYLLLVFAPGIFIGVKKGVGWGITTIVVTVFWLIFYMVLAFVLLFLISGWGYSSGIMPVVDF